MFVRDGWRKIWRGNLCAERWQTLGCASKSMEMDAARFFTEMGNFNGRVKTWDSESENGLKL